jgi:uncharacterized membrane protein YgcG
MKKNNLLILLIVFQFSFFHNVTGQEIYPSLPEKPSISDSESILNAKEEKKLRRFLNRIKRKHSITIYAFTSDKENILEFTEGIYNQHCDNNNCFDVLVIVVSATRKKIETKFGPRISELLSDSEMKNILNENFIPYFKNEEFFKGLKAGINEIKNEIKF